jgi:hypothetical protein
MGFTFRMPAAGFKLFMYLSKLTPAPNRACDALAVSQAGPLTSAMAALNYIGILKLPLALYTDNTFNKPLHFK